MSATTQLSNDEGLDALFGDHPNSQSANQSIKESIQQSTSRLINQSINQSLSGVTQRALRWPLVFIVGLILFAELIAYIIVRLIVFFYELFTSYLDPNRKLKQSIKQSNTFNEWANQARLIDRLEHRDDWKSINQSIYYDWQMIEDTLNVLRKCRESLSQSNNQSNNQASNASGSKSNNQSVIQSTNQSINQSKPIIDLMRNLLSIFTVPNYGGIANSQLYHSTNIGTKTLIQAFIQEIAECTVLIANYEQSNNQSTNQSTNQSNKQSNNQSINQSIKQSNSPLIDLSIKRAWFKRAIKSYGRSALLLSGGGGLGYYHIGVIKALQEAKCLPRVICGASAGSLMTGYLAVRRDDELDDFFKPEIASIFRACHESWLTRITRWLRRRYLFDVNDWMVQVRREITRGDVTFAEAFKMTGRHVNITVTASSKYVPSMLLNARSTPDVLIWSAILASSAMPNIIQPVELLCKDKSGHIKPFHIHGKAWRDGTIKSDIPIKEVGASYNANFFIVSQVNPHLLPFFYPSRGTTGRPSSRGGSRYRGGFILSLTERLLKLEMRKWLSFLGELDLLPTFFGADWRYLFLQSVGGSVTIVPNASVSAYLHMVDDPTVSQMEKYIKGGEQATWAKLARIANHVRIERLLLECKSKLDEEWKKQQTINQPIKQSNKQEQEHIEPFNQLNNRTTINQSNDQSNNQSDNLSIDLPKSSFIQSKFPAYEDDDSDVENNQSNNQTISELHDIDSDSEAKDSDQSIKQTTKQSIKESIKESVNQTVKLPAPIGFAQQPRRASYVQLEGAIQAAMQASINQSPTHANNLNNPKETRSPWSPLNRSRSPIHSNNQTINQSINRSMIPEVVYDDEGLAYQVGESDDSEDDQLPESPLRSM